MMKRLSLAIAAAAAVMVPAVAPAQVVRQFTRKDLNVQLDPTLGYIFYRTVAAAPMIFIREPDSADFAAWSDLRQKAFDKAMKKYQGEYRRWRATMDVWEGSSVSQRRGLVAPSVSKPVMPSLETFAFPAIEIMTMTEAVAGRPFFKEKPVYGYLIGVKPGTYAVYGSVIVTGTGFVGVCMCMGTVKFEAKPGEIVDLGIFGVHGVPTGGPMPRLLPYAKPLPSEIRPFEGALPALLQGLPVHPVAFQAAGKLPNYFGVTIDRLYPMPGVLAYKRDTVIDVRSGQPLSDQNGTSALGAGTNKVTR